MIARLPASGRHGRVFEGAGIDVVADLEWSLRERPSGVRISDLGGSRAAHTADTEASRAETKRAILGYLRRLKETLLFAFSTMAMALLVGSLAVADFFWFMRTGQSVLHPALDLILLLAAACAFGLAIASALVTKRYLEQTIRKLAEAC